MTPLGRRSLPRELLPEELARHRRPREADVDGEEGNDRLELVPRHAVLEGPADVTAKSIVDAALRDQRSHHDDAAIAQAELVVVPRAAGRVDRLLAEACTVVRSEPRGDFRLVDTELTGVRAQAACIPLRVTHADLRCWMRSMPTARIRINPITISCQKLEMPRMARPFCSVPMNSTPTAVPVTPPPPPVKLVPPRSTAAADPSGMSAPTIGLAAPSRPAWITPASAAHSPTMP